MVDAVQFLSDDETVERMFIEARTEPEAVVIALMRDRCHIPPKPKQNHRCSTKNARHQNDRKSDTMDQM